MLLWGRRHKYKKEEGWCNSYKWLTVADFKFVEGASINTQTKVGLFENNQYLGVIHGILSKSRIILNNFSFIK